MNDDSRARVRIHGYCDRDEEAVLAALDAHGPRVLSTFEGIYALSVERGNDVYLATSHSGLHQYYYCTRGGRFFHGPSLSAVLRSSGLPWQWNFDALGDLLQLDFMLDEKTLHPDVERMPAGAVLHVAKGASPTFLRRDTWAERYEQGVGSGAQDALANEAVRALNEETARWLAGRPVALALSGGYDSRVVLGSLLHAGVKPHVLAMGAPDSTDVTVSRKIAAGLGLSYQHIPIETGDYLRHGHRIVELTGGAQVAWHWHAYIFAHKSGIAPNTALFGGNGGELSTAGIVRTLLDLGVVTQIFDPMTRALGASRAILFPYWIRKQHSPFNPEEMHLAHESIRGQYDIRERIARAMGCADFEQGSVMEKLDKWFMMQRVRSFHGLTQNLVSDTCMAIQPFISQRWIEVMWRLDRHWKLGMRWVRHALKKNAPELMSYPDVNKQGIMAERIADEPPALYWLKRRPPMVPWVPFANYDATFSDPAILDTIAGAPGLEDLFERSAILSVIEQQRQSATRTRAVALLLLLATWTEHLKTIYGAREARAAA